MDDKVAGRILNIQESSTLLMSKLTRELTEKGKDIINLTLGEPDFDTPHHIKEAAEKAIEEGITHYPPVCGFMSLRKAIADKLKRDNGLEYLPSQVIVSTGAKQSIINVVLSLVDEGDEVIIPAPFWVSYPEMVKLADGKIVFMPTKVENDYKITASQLEATITPRTKAFIYSSPSNPTGSSYSYEELQLLAEVFARHPQVYIISDEIYEYINFSGMHASLAQFPEIFERTVVINGMSKGFAMTGWRMGYMAGPQWIVNACEKLQGQFTSGASSISQMASLAALTSSLEPTFAMRDEFCRRRDLMVERLKDVKGLKFNIPTGAFYLFPDVSYYFGMKHRDVKINSSEDLCMYLLMEGGVSTVAGTGFGAKECLRISFAASVENLNIACDRIINALDKLK
jgi:aspartate aminotransferase